MKKYIVVNNFKDKEDGQKYITNGRFPKSLRDITEERIAFLIENDYIREAELSEYEVSELIEYMILDLHVSIENLTAENYNIDYLISLINSNDNENDDEYEKERKEIIKKLKKAKKSFNENMTLDELNSLLDE